MSKTFRNVLILVIILPLIVGGIYYSFKAPRKSLSGVRVQQTAKSKQENQPQKRQAVFLTNGQVYFGFVLDADKPIVTIKDAYAVKADDLLPTDETNEKRQIIMTKTSNELHNPEDAMYVNRDHILFYQTISDQSKVNETIKKSASNPSGQ